MVHLDPTEESARALLAFAGDGPVLMLNLLRFRAWADYAEAPELAPGGPVSGEAAYDAYVAHTRPYLEASGGAVVFEGPAGPWFIGPEAESWDRAMVIRQASVAALFGMARDPACAAGLGHRRAALADSRLLPVRAHRR